MSYQIPNLSFLRRMPVFGGRLYESLQNIATAITNVGMQTNSSPQQLTPAPPQINGLSVVAGGGVAHVQITDNNEIYRGIGYHVDISTNPGFTSFITHHMGPSRDVRIPVPTAQALYYRAFSDYPTSEHSTPVYFGGSAPTALTASGTKQPVIPSGQGSGTGQPGQISGHGPVPYRTTTGAPPSRG